MDLLERLIEKTNSVDKTVVLPEGQDRRVLEAAQRIAAAGIAKVIVLATDDEVYEVRLEPVAEEGAVTAGMVVVKPT